MSKMLIFVIKKKIERKHDIYEGSSEVVFNMFYDKVNM